MARIKCRRNNDEIRKQLFDSTRHNLIRLGEGETPNWCKLAETRLAELVMLYKPAGINGKWYLAAICDGLNFIQDDENIDFEMYLSPDDYAVYKETHKEGSTPKSRYTFRPRYGIRPTPRQVLEKLNEMYDMKVIEAYEYRPEGFEMQSDFFLPEGPYSELMKEKEDSLISLPPPRKRPRRGGSPDSHASASRDSTPRV
ncbi:hypothetical protein WR25_11599 [Diploscapter pachys]|uniref:Uncharacterized protein n=1 Tax=Diploscapter pachys TaxID=2018661 RepID=A0A2A2KR07_9BILA|nr:hypothetical protein WR25_11599 [Diploscapter pachys]